MPTLILAAVLAALGPQLMPFGRSPEAGLAGFWRIIDVRVGAWAAGRPLTARDAPLLEYAVAFRDGAVQGPSPLACPQARYSSGFVYADDLFDKKVPAGRGPAVSKAAGFQDNGATSFIVACGNTTRDFHLDSDGRLQFAEGDLVYTIAQWSAEDRPALGYAGPSFDCTKARSIGEKLICADAGLSRYDRQLNDAYQRLKKSESPASFATVQAAQSAWVAFVQRSCDASGPPAADADKVVIGDCLSGAYEDRAAQLAGVAVAAKGGVTIEPRMRFHSTLKPKVEDSDAYPWMAAGPNADAFNAAIAKAFSLGKRRTSDTRTFPPPSPDDDAPAGIFARRHYHVIRADDRLVSLQVLSSDYAGGAHESPSEWSFTWDVAGGRELGLADVFTGAWETFATNYCVRDLTRQRDGAPVERTQVAAVVRSAANWLFDDKGAVVHFGVYQIGAFAEGETDVDIPYTALARFLKPGSPLR